MNNTIKKGYMYILTNPSLSCLKIGKTNNIPEDYAHELSESESIPTPFSVAFYIFFNDCFTAEETIHEKFRHNRVNNDGDFFNIPQKKAIKIIENLAQEKLCKDLGKNHVNQSDFKRLETEFGYEHIKAEMKRQGEDIDNYDIKALRRELKKEKTQHLLLQKIHESKLREIKKLNNQIAALREDLKRKSSKYDKLKFEFNSVNNELDDLKERLSENNFDFTISKLMSEQELEQTKRYTNLQKALKKPSEVYRIDLINKELIEIPPQIGKLKNLQELCIWSNNLSVLPEEIGNLTNMQSLYMSDNEFKTLPGEVLEMSNLSRLDLKNNSFSNLPPEIRKLKKLKILYLSHNNLTSLPDEIGELTNLQELDLKGNPVSQQEKDRIKKLLPKVQIRF